MLIRKALRWLGYCIALFIILAATAVSISQLLSPYLNDHRAELSAWASHLLNIPVTINQVEISWKSGEPELVLRQVAVLNKQTQKPTFQIQKIKINVKIIQSLLQRKLLAEDIRIYDVHLTLHHKKSGQLNVEGLDNFVFMDNFTKGSVAGNAVGAWIFSQPNLALRDIEITYIPESGPERSVTLASLDLHNTRTQHVLMGRATLNQAMPTQIKINLTWEGNTFDIMHSTSKVHLYLYLESIALPQWISQQTWQNLKIKQGVGSGKFWITWDHGQLQKVQSQFQLYEIQLQSLITKKMAMISRMNGRLGWERDGERQRITGEDILIDFPQHLWPVTQFSLLLSPEEAAPKPPLKRKMRGYALQVDYVDIGDVNELLLASGLLSESSQKLLKDLNPVGEVSSLKIQTDGTSQLANTLYSAEFSDLALNPWQNFPGVANMAGKIFWDGKQGKLILNSQKTTLTLNTVFAKSLEFNTVTGDMQWQKNAANDWSIAMKNFQVSNEDISLNANMTLLFPANASPILDLTGDFSVPHAAKIENYLPVKQFEPPLVEWLHHRFQGGQLVSGKMIAQGKLSDFPFENGTGKFLVSARIKDLEFEYAPGWPMVHHVEGNLVFSGHSMTADMESGQLLDVPISDVHGYIPYIGPLHPQVLDLKAVVHADIGKGLLFIQESPLRNTIGKDLAGMQLSGPMELKLAFTIPVKTPEKSLVAGDVAVSSTTLQLPDWHLSMDHMAGQLHFTEQAVQTTQMQGQLFGETATLNISTMHEPNSPPIVKAILQSKISQPLLAQWLHLPLSQYISGAASYTAQLNIISHKYPQPSQLLIHSDLLGITINLPDMYGKKAADARNFDLTTTLNQDKPMQVKLTYGTLLTAAFTYDNSDHKTVKKTESNTLSQYVRDIDIHAQKIPLLGQNLTQVHVQVVQEKNDWKISVNSPEAIGDIWLPDNSKAAINAKFQHLDLVAPKDETKLLDPKTIPAIYFEGDNVQYKNTFIGHVIFNIKPDQAGLQIQKLNIFTDSFNLNAMGHWSLQQKRNQTVLQGSLTSQNVSKLLDHWKLGSSNLIASNGNITFDLKWQDTPYNPSLASLSGYLFLKMGKGRVINLGNSTDTKLGFGRMLNILSLQTLPRRLSLDFTDLFEKGYSFDNMQGHFNLTNGNANTQDTYFEGPIAKIEIKGKIGLAVRDYDLLLAVTPYVTGSIPVVATLAGGPVVGAVTWVVEKVASGVVSKAATYHYSVKGPWENPVWEQTKSF